jgi:hypothetical protein
MVMRPSRSKRKVRSTAIVEQRDLDGGVRSKRGSEQFLHCRLRLNRVTVGFYPPHFLIDAALAGG